MKIIYIAAVAAIIHSIASRLSVHQAPSTNTSCLSSNTHTPRANSHLPQPILSHPARGFDEDDQADDADWQKHANKGGALTCALLGTDQAAGQLLNDQRTPPSAASIWTGDLRPELDKWYWHRVDPATYSCKLNDHWNIPFAMRSLGLNGDPTSEGGDNACFRVEHWDPNKQENGRQVPAINQWYTVDGKEYRSTNAHYEFAINTKGGAIHTFYLESPFSAARTLWHANRKSPDPSALPSLRALSDILWAFWTLRNPNVQHIRYFSVLGITNEVTNQIIARCLRSVGKELREWPGVAFDGGSEEGHALIGSPNGAAFAYFLVQRKAELGYKSIGRVTVFRPESDDDLAFVDPALVFHVVDVPEPEREHGGEGRAEVGGGANEAARVHGIFDGGGA